MIDNIIAFATLIIGMPIFFTLLARWMGGR